MAMEYLGSMAVRRAAFSPCVFEMLGNCRWLSSYALYPMRTGWLFVNRLDLRVYQKLVSYFIETALDQLFNVFVYVELLISMCLFLGGWSENGCGLLR